jgi:hypothetical protein
MERMTSKSILEARAVRIIALVTLLYLPPSFTAVSVLDTPVYPIFANESQTLFGMGYLHTTDKHGGRMRVTADADFWFYLALTIPLMLVTIVAWLAWDIRSRRKYEREENSSNIEKGGLEMGVLSRMSFRSRV